MRLRKRSARSETRAFPSSWPLVSSTVCSVVALAVAGCGGGTDERATRTPVLPGDLAAQLAAQSEDVAAKLDAGDAAGARRDALALRRDVFAAIDAGRVPAALRRPLLAGVRRLVAEIPPPPPPAEAENHDQNGNEKGKHTGKEKHGGGDD